MRAEEEEPSVKQWGIKNAFGGFAGLGVLLKSPETEESRLQHAVEVSHCQESQLFVQLYAFEAIEGVQVHFDFLLTYISRCLSPGSDQTHVGQ